jgi:hypothetical protein
MTKAVCWLILLCVSLPAQDWRQSLTFYATFDQGLEANFALGDKHIYTAPDYKAQMEAKRGLDTSDVTVVAGGVTGSALRFGKKNLKAIFYQGDKNVSFRDGGWTGSISFWLNLDPDQDLEPGFCDPIQVTDKAYNDSAIWVDFTKDDKPRHFRLGVFGDLNVWNPTNLPSDKNPAFSSRLITVATPPFRRGTWTHVVITHTGLGSGKGMAKLYLDGKLQGTTERILEPFRWDTRRAAIRLGVNYVGLWDELAIFNIALSDREVAELFRLKGGLASPRR